MEILEPNNPFLMPEDPFEGYRENIEKLKNRPEAVQFEKMCYELFESYELGRKFMEHVTENMLLKPSADIEAANFDNRVVWGEGFKAFPLMIRNLIISHAQRIKAGADDARRNA